jgi:type I restriction enzyme S subunit
MAADSIVGAVPGTWEVTTLGDLVRRGGGFIQTGPFGSQLHSADYVQSGIPAIMPTNIGENRVNTNGIARIGQEDAARLSRYLVQRGDIVYSRRGDIEKRALIRDQEAGWLCGTGCLMVRLGDQSPVLPTYASYYLSHPSVRQWLTQHAVGATMPNLNTSIMQALPFVLPSRDEQAVITSVLATLDDKIDLNQRINRTVIAIARAIFKAWFIDFLPVHAKEAGETEFPGMPQEAFAELPRELYDSPLGSLPLGWQHVPIGQLVTVAGGGTPSTKVSEYWEGGEHAFCTPKDLSRISSPVLLDTERHLTRLGVEKISSGQLPVGTVVLSSRAPIGYLAITDTPVSVNQGIIAMHSQEVPSAYILLWSEWNMDIIESRSGGSTFAEISKRSFKEIPALKPDGLTLAAFDSATRPLFDLMVSNERESDTLAFIRDSILPRLVSGEIRVSGAEGLIDGQ